MANSHKSVPENVPGRFFVDATCISRLPPSFEHPRPGKLDTGREELGLHSFALVQRFFEMHLRIAMHQFVIGSPAEPIFLIPHKGTGGRYS